MQFDSGNSEFTLSFFIENINIKSRLYISDCGTSKKTEALGSTFAI